MRLFSITLAFILAAGIALADDDSHVAHRLVTVTGTRTRYVLPHGATSFIVRLTERGKAGDFVFVNENSAAEGELLIAVSKESLAANSPRWSAVEGTVRFHKKRFFNVSLVGVEARYVRLTFRVEVPRRKSGKTAGDRARPYKLARIASS